MRYIFNMRMCLVLSSLLVSCPALAWEAGVDGAICTLDHAQDASGIRLTYDPAGALYTVTVRGPELWAESPYFGMRFDGAAPNTITTDRHVVSNSGRDLSVSDGGFGNVLNGLARNQTAIAFTQSASVVFDLEGAAPEVAVFEACVTQPTA